MSQYFSRIYRGFLIEQTDKGWNVPQLPNWSNGPVAQGPYATYQIACHVLDRVLDSTPEIQPTTQKQVIEPEVTMNPSDFGILFSLLFTQFIVFCFAFMLGVIALMPFKTGNFNLFSMLLTLLSGGLSIHLFHNLIISIKDLIHPEDED